MCVHQWVFTYSEWVYDAKKKNLDSYSTTESSKRLITSTVCTVGEISFQWQIVSCVPGCRHVYTCCKDGLVSNQCVCGFWHSEPASDGYSRKCASASASFLTAGGCSLVGMWPLSHKKWLQKCSHLLQNLTYWLWNDQILSGCLQFVVFTWTISRPLQILSNH